MKFAVMFLSAILGFYTSLLCEENLIRPLPLNVTANHEKALLGKKLFSDTRLSKDNTISCESCHLLGYSGADALEVSLGVAGKKGAINSPTVFNARYNLAQFWDGRSRSLKDQVIGPLTNPVEMGMDAQSVVKNVSEDNSYVEVFNRLYSDGITIENIADAIAEFEMLLVTPNSKFDQFLRGNKGALNKQELEGYELFKSRGCISCHNGINMGSNMYQQFGIFLQYEGKYGNLGRFNVTKNEDDKYFFKVPTLRNIERTAPYFHDGSSATLHDAVNRMALFQLGRNISDAEVEKIVLFLHTLNGEIPKIVKQEQ